MLNVIKAKFGKFYNLYYSSSFPFINDGIITYLLGKKRFKNNNNNNNYLLKKAIVDASKNISCLSFNSSFLEHELSLELELIRPLNYQINPLIV